MKVKYKKKKRLQTLFRMCVYALPPRPVLLFLWFAYVPVSNILLPLTRVMCSFAIIFPPPQLVLYRAYIRCTLMSHSFSLSILSYNIQTSDNDPINTSSLQQHCYIYQLARVYIDKKNLHKKSIKYVYIIWILFQKNTIKYVFIEICGL